MDDTYLIAPNLRWLRTQSPEWNRVWAKLQSIDFGPPRSDYHDCGEKWSYMGTTRPTSSASTWHHHFRHYYHPSTAKQENVYILSLDDHPKHYIYR